MFQRTLATVLMALLLVNATWQQESLVFSNSNLDTTEVGIAKSLLKLLVNTKEATYESVTGDTINSIAETYYGSSSFSLLLVRGNADIEFPSTSDVLTVGTQLRLPSVLLCPQFLGVDCLLTSYQKSLPLDDSTNNYWKNLPAQTLTRVEEFMSYPNYMTFIMSALTSQDLNPTLNLNIKISNYAHADLTNGTITFTTGFGKTPEAVIPVNSVSNYHAQRSDLLHGIHGTLSYLIRDESGQEQPFSLTFHVYAGNGSIWNTFSFGDQVETGAPTSQNSGFRNLQIGSHLIAWSSITESPDVQINIVLESSTDPLTFNDELKVIKSNSTGKAFEGPYASFLVGYRSFIYRQNNEPWQNWRFVPLSDEWKHRNQFRISNDNSTFSLTADEAQSIILYEDADENNKNQIWSVIPLGKDLYQIRSSNGLCLHAAVDIVPRNPPVGAATTTAREVWLEACDAANVDQQWNIIDQTAWSYSR